MAKKAKIRLLFLILPDEMQINNQLFNRILKEKKLSLDDIDSELPQNILISFLNKNNIEFINILEYFKKDNKALNYYQPNDSHFNIYGTEALSKILYPKLFSLLTE
jgi:hypothetical protein